MAKRQIKDYIWRPGISYNGNKYPAAYTSLENNIEFLKAEAVAYINSRITTDTQASLFPNGARLFDENIEFLKLETLLYIEDRVNAGAPGFNNYTYNQDKCERDLGYVLEAIHKDLRWGGNWNTRYIASFYWIGDEPQIDGDRQAEIQTYQWLEGIVNTNIMTGNLYSSLQSPGDSTYTPQEVTGPYGESGVTTRVSELFGIIYDVIENGLDNLPDISLATYPFAEYTYNQAKCERDTGYVLDAYLYDLRYGGNEKIVYVARHYWEGDTAQIDGDRQPETETHRYLSNVIQEYIITNVEYEGKLNTTVDQEIDEALTYVSGTAEIIESDTQILLDVIRNGLSSLPSIVEAGYTKIKLIGHYYSKDLLLITNTTKNAVIYNFSTNTLGGVVTREMYENQFLTEDPDYPAFKQRSDAITVIHLYADTSDQDVTDDIQIFVEETEIKTRPFDFGTDAIERMRVAQPLSMLDADFEYGLQPTKWQAIATQRGYPSIYEVPGTELNIDTITSDASTTTDGIGSSIITVNTIGTHGLEPGQPITVIGLDQSKLGYARAEGSFVVITAPTGNSFTYFAKGRVGSTNGESIQTEFAQIREGGFYTGASIGNPSFTIVSNGTSGTLTSVFDTPAGGSRIAFTGIAPEIGAPIQGDSIPIGAQVTGIVGSGGIVASPGLVGTYSAGTTELTVSDPTGIVPNLGLNDGSGNLILVDDIVGSTITLSDPLTGELAGDVQTYTGITGTNIVGTPTDNATFNVTRGAETTYTNVEVNTAGAGFQEGDTIKILGSDIGGTTPANDLYITVASVGSDSSNNIDSVLWRGEANPILSQTIIGISDVTYSTSGSGSGATFDVLRGTTEYTVTLNNSGQDFANGEIITIPGNIFNNGATPTNDVAITVQTVSESYSDVAQSSTSGTGTGALWNVEKDGTTYATVTQAVLADSTIGDGYANGDTITLSGTDLGGTSPANDLTITITEIAKVYSDLPSSGSASGTSATFGLIKVGTAYLSLLVVDAGDGYATGETLTISGTDLDASTPANDATFTVDQVTKTYTGLSQDSTTGSGTSAVFEVTKNVDQASGQYFVNITDGGSGYNGGDEVRILGTSLDGASPANDLIMEVSSVDGSGVIQSVNVTGVAGGTGGVFAVTGLSGTAGGTGFISSYSFAGTAGGTGQISSFTTSGLANGSQTYVNILGQMSASQGNGAVFEVQRNQGTYIVTVTTAGTLYQRGNQILVTGDNLGGATPANDLIINVNTIDGNGGIFSVFSDSNSQAVSGTPFDLYSTVLISENTADVVPAGTLLIYEALATIDASFLNPHGIVPGGNFIVTITSDDGSNKHNLVSGSFSANSIPSLNTLRFNARAPGQIDEAGGGIEGAIYTRPDSFFVHRPFDGGVQLGTGGPQYGAQAIRQSKKYIRYQSGKGIMYTTGALFAPSYDILDISADNIEIGSTITVELGDNDHGLQPGATVRIIGCETSGYNGDYVVDDVVSERIFTYISTKRLGSKRAILSPECQVSTLYWTGAIIRAGIFDDQNGIFWEYDGQELAVVQRTSTKQIAGTISISPDSNIMTGNGTRFRDQLKAGDRIVIKGMTHVVSKIDSQTVAYVAPDFRGVSEVAGAKASLVQDKRVRQADFNIDRLDGHGPSGYNVDITKMQMIGIQYSWYGAGFIDYMLRGADGNFVYVHRIRNSNVNTEAFMRSGNLPVRYEVTNEGPVARLVNDVNVSQTFVELDDVDGFSEEGTIYIDNEIMRYTAVDTNLKRLTGITRGSTYSLFAQGADRVYSAGAADTHDKRTGVVLLTNTTTPLISHWGSAFITDGMFDEDRGYIFSYAATGVDITGTRATAFLLRLAPSVSNAVTGDLGERELLNRAQLLLQGIEVTSDGFSGSTPIQGGIIVEGVLNPQNYPTNVADVSWSGLATPAQGGQPSFAQVAPGGSIDWGATTSTTTATVSGDIDTGFVYPVAINNEFNSPSSITISGYNAAGPALVGAEMYSQNPNAYTGTGQGTYYVESIGTGDGGNTIGLFFRSTTGRTQATQRLTTASTVRLIFRTYTGRTSRLLFTKSSWEASGATVGTPVSVTDTKWPAGTAVVNVELKQLGQTQFYEVTFNQTSLNNISASDTVTFEFGEPGYAEPGETVFKFIAVPGERSELDLSQLKELTNTTLGGRGTFPNGPDVLAINIYKATGADTAGNIVLKWGEAQA